MPRVLLPVVIAAAGVGGAIAALVLVDRPEKSVTCVGELVVGAPRGPTPDAAVAAWMRQRGWDPADWESIPDDDDADQLLDYQQTDVPASQTQYLRVTLDGDGSDYEVIGSCKG